MKKVGILTAGGDGPGLNATIRGFGKAAIGRYGMELVGFPRRHPRPRGEPVRPLDSKALSGILYVGGTILGTSRDKELHRMEVDSEIRDMRETIAENLKAEGIDALVVLGGGGSQKNAMRLAEVGVNVIHLYPRPS